MQQRYQQIARTRIFKTLKDDPGMDARGVLNEASANLSLEKTSLTYNHGRQIRKATKGLINGDINEIYQKCFHRMELLKDYDKRMRIFVVVTADEIDPIEFQRYQESCQRPRQGNKNFTKNMQPKSLQKKVYANRIIGIYGCFGSAIRRKAAYRSGELPHRRVRTTDHCHCYGPHRGVMGHICGLCSDNEIFAETISCESQNESQTTLHRLFSVDRICLGEMDEKDCIISDRCVGIDPVVALNAPRARHDNCCTHVKTNMTDKVKANEEELLLWTDVQTELDPGPNGYGIAMDHFVRTARPTVRKYVVESVLGPRCGAHRLCNSQISGEREGLYCTQPSESLNGKWAKGTAESVRSLPLPLQFQEAFFSETVKLQKLRERYGELVKHGKPYPPKVALEIYSRSRLGGRFILVITGPEQADVTADYECSDYKTHRIDVRNYRFTCNYRCLEITGRICANGIAYLEHYKLNVSDYVPMKWKSSGGLSYVSTSLMTLPSTPPENPINSELQPCAVPLLPPHTVVSSGRKRKRRFRRGQRTRAYAVWKYNSQCKRAAVRGEDPVEMPEELKALRTHTCTGCGIRGHNRDSCPNPTNGRGEFMSTQDQKKALSNGVLFVEIGEVGKTNYPRSLTQFLRMQKKVFSPHATGNR